MKKVIDNDRIPPRVVNFSPVYTSKLQDCTFQPNTGLGNHVSMKAACRELLEEGIAVVDGVFGDGHCASLNEALKELHNSGALPPGELGNRDLKQWDSRAPLICRPRRGDVSAWLPFTTKIPREKKAVSAATSSIWDNHAHKVGELLYAIASVMRSSNNSQSPPIPSRELLQTSRCMGAVYTPESGMGFVPHYDNPPSAQNGRILTAVYYCNIDPSEWNAEENGGELQVFLDEKVTTTPVETLTRSNKENPSSRKILPHGDRLVIFWSERILHTVKASKRRRRFAVTVWLENIEEMSATIEASSGFDASYLSSAVPMPMPLKVSTMLSRGSFGSRLQPSQGINKQDNST